MVTTRASSTRRMIRPSDSPSKWKQAWDWYAESDFILQEEQLDKLANHTYSSCDTSWLDEMCMKAFWDRVVEFYPRWLAPNLITLIGLLVNASCLFVFFLHCPTASEEAPRWVYLLSGAGLFVYQTLDATDGKQARRIKCASPLGEMFDHGCDSMSQIIVTLQVCYTLRLGQLGSSIVFYTCVFSIIIFYAAHWSTYCTGKLQFARFDVTEAQMLIILTQVITAILGPNLWTIGVGPVDLRSLVLLAGCLGLFRQAWSYLQTIMEGGGGKNGATVADSSVIFPLFPLLAVIIPFGMIHSKTSPDIDQEQITIFALFFGAVAAKATNRVIVAYMSRSELFIWDWIYLGPLALILNQYWNLPLPEVPLLYASTLYAYINLLVYCYFVTRQLCARLNINCLTVSPRKPE